MVRPFNLLSSFSINLILHLEEVSDYRCLIIDHAYNTLNYCNKLILLFFLLSMASVLSCNFHRAHHHGGFYSFSS